MSTLIVPQDLVPELLPMRTLTWMPDRSGLLGLMPAWLGDPAALGVKAISYLPANHGTERDSHQGAVLLFDTATGSLLAIIDASSVTAIRTAAASGLAAEDLAAAHLIHARARAEGKGIAVDFGGRRTEY
jgi:ornithine cyclodeaminase/alanine dehydrogenase-like protein (mu-crystallin family)